MGSFGERMQREREMRGITLEEIAESTKIGTRSLRALEGEDFDKLPGGIFNKGFVRAYAKYLGIDEEQAVTDFMAAYGDHQQQQPQAEPQETKLQEEAPPLSLNLLAVGGAVVVLALFLVIWGFHDRLSGAASRLSHRFRRAPAVQAPNAVAAIPNRAIPTPPAGAQTTGSAAAGDKAPAAPAAAGPADPSSAKAAKPVAPESAFAAPEMAAAGREFVLQVHARQDAWVKIKADDELLMEGVLKGDKTVHARQKVVFTTGNAAAIELSFNGEPQPALGADNQVKTVVFTADGRVR
ncbi:MAG TPA: RodZ domain-containing protein [Terriglobales bacterium]|nr:RodZ domain-containing protein [Terriglobales bacterium]